MKGGTLFSGIGAPELAGPHIDWRWCAEIDPFACALLAERFPDLRNLGDVNRIEPDAVEPVDLVVFGSPCQSFSVAGNRGGAADPRGALAFVALGIVGRIRPRWVVFENVPGLLSSASGRDFGAILGALAKCGYGLAYRILDAQFFGVPQRRRRVFVVGCLGDWRAAAAVLFERDGLRRDPPARAKAGEGIAPLLEIGTGNSGSADRACCDLGIGAPGDPMYALQRGKHHGIVPIQGTLDRNKQQNGLGIGKAGGPQFTLTGRDQHAVAFAFQENMRAEVTISSVAKSLNSGGGKPGQGYPAIAFESRFARNGRGAPGSVVPPLKAQSGQTGKGDAAPLVFKPSHFTRGKDGAPSAISPPLSADADKGDQDSLLLRNCAGQPPRRLTPRECERLQGLPDDWTAITYRGKPAADGPRYRAVGNSMAVPVVAWLLRRIAPNYRINEFVNLNEMLNPKGSARNGW